MRFQSEDLQLCIKVTALQLKLFPICLGIALDQVLQCCEIHEQQHRLQAD